jgi:hypothetical protein
MRFSKLNRLFFELFFINFQEGIKKAPIFRSFDHSHDACNAVILL